MLPTFRGKRQNSAWFSISLFKVAMPQGRCWYWMLIFLEVVFQ